MDKKNQVIKRLVKALEFYADPQYWTRVYGRYANDRRMWIGPGDGDDLARRALQEVEGFLNEETNALHDAGDALEKGGSDGR